MVEVRNAYRILVIKPEGKEQPGRSRHNLEDNIKTKLIGCGGVDWIPPSVVGGLLGTR
jgi:hypothetical protein